MKIFNLKVAGLALSLLIGCNALAITVYDTSTSFDGHFFTVTNGQQIGNQISLSSASVHLTGFSFEYATTTFTSASVGVDLRFYLNNGAPVSGYASPGTLFYDSGVFSPLPAAPSGTNVNYGLADFYPPLSSSFVLPTNFTFTLTFSGLASGDILRLLLGNPPSGQIGSATPDYWYNTGGPWSLLTTSPSYSSDLLVKITGTVPDAPATAGLLSLGFIGMFVLRHKFASNLNTKNLKP